ncbi:hypothetical protein AB6A40_002628 [Gnathostoma spinigerum]|uniref:Uncharacterized protein n=1 Tax=Gnathostoma spinigerum TaxID=75299 RepID=A0ABD6EEY8_9BILA
MPTCYTCQALSSWVVEFFRNFFRKPDQHGEKIDCAPKNEGKHEHEMPLGNEKYYNVGWFERKVGPTDDHLLTMWQFLEKKAILQRSL